MLIGQGPDVEGQSQRSQLPLSDHQRPCSVRRQLLQVAYRSFEYGFGRKSTIALWKPFSPQSRSKVSRRSSDGVVLRAERNWCTHLDDAGESSTPATFHSPWTSIALALPLDGALRPCWCGANHGRVTQPRRIGWPSSAKSWPQKRSPEKESCDAASLLKCHILKDLYATNSSTRYCPFPMCPNPPNLTMNEALESII